MVTANEVAAVLRRVASGELLAARANDKAEWKDGWANIAFRAGGWTVVVFVDGWELDYVDSAVSPDGRTGDYDVWASTVGDDGDEDGRNPLDLLDDGEIALLTKVFESSL